MPVVDEDGAPIGMVSEGDLIGRGEPDREARRYWWLTSLAEGEMLSAEFLASLRDPERRARDVTIAPVVTVGEETELSEVGQLLTAYRIKRVPVLRDGRIVASSAAPISSELSRKRGANRPATPRQKPGCWLMLLLGSSNVFCITSTK